MIKCVKETMIRIVIAISTWMMTFSVQAQDASVYLRFGCEQCHGLVGQGGSAGLRLAPEPLPYEDFADIVRRPYGVMPAYSPNVLNETQMRAIYAYLTAVAEPPALDAIPLLQLD